MSVFLKPWQKPDFYSICYLEFSQLRNVRANMSPEFLGCFLTQSVSETDGGLCALSQKFPPTRSLTCLCIGGCVHSTSDRGVHGWRVAGATGGSVVVGNAYKVCSPALTPRGWHQSLGVVPSWRTVPRTPLPLCPASESVGCHRRHYWGPTKCCSHWQSVARCCG